MKKVTLTIQNGHRNATNGMTGTSGTTSDGKHFDEVDYIDQVFYAMKDRLIAEGIELYYDDATIVNGAKTDYFIALHADGSNNPSVRGGFVDDTPLDLVADKSWKFAQVVADNYFTKVGIPFRPEGRTNNSKYYYAFQYTGENTKQFIMELGFMTNQEDMNKLADIHGVANALVDGIVAYLFEYDENYKAYKAEHSQGALTPVGTDRLQRLEKAIADLKAILNTV